MSALPGLAISPADPDADRGLWPLRHVLSLAGLSAAAWGALCWVMVVLWAVITGLHIVGGV